MKGQIVRSAKYVLITAARNEEKYIEKTIQSVLSQTILPQKWLIVSDASTDRSDEIIRQYAKKCNFIQLIRLDSSDNRNFASQVYAQKAGISQLEGIEYEFLGLLDADVSLERDYYERVLAKFQENVKLGIAGGVLFENTSGEWVRLYNSIFWSVGGPIQMFRRQCYEAIDYIPLNRGGQDAIAEVMARMHGWEVRSFPDIKVFHHRATGTAKGGLLSARFRQGMMEYSLGYHPLFEIARCIFRLLERPYLLGSWFRLSGYAWAFLQGVQREVPEAVVKFLRHEQIQRLYNVVSHSKSL